MLIHCIPDGCPGPRGDVNITSSASGECLAEAATGRRTDLCGFTVMMVTPVTVSPASRACTTGAAPRHRGSRLACTFRTPLTTRGTAE